MPASAKLCSSTSHTASLSSVIRTAGGVMKAVLCTHFGTADELELADIAEPQAGPGEAVVRVKAAALNFFDTLIIAGKYQYKPPFPFSPAAEFSGVVDSVGSGVTEFAPGDRVMGHMGWGAAREAVAIAVQQLAKLPDALDFERAAGLNVIYATTLYALRDRAQLKPGETLLVLGASGGTGLAAVEVGKMMGARVIAAASSDEKLAFARAHGADATVNYDPVGGPYAEPAVRSLAWLGRYLVVGFAAGEIPKLPLNLVLLRGCDIRGVFWGAWLKREPQAQRALMTDLVKWCAEGKLSAHVHAVYPLAETATALKAISDRKVMGKILLRP